jgi:putative membrane protein
MGIAIAVPALVAFYLAQRRGGQRILEFVFSRFAGDRNWAVLGTVDAVYRYLKIIYAGRRRLVISIVIHMAGWIVGAGEVMFALSFAGHSVSFSEALIIESLMHAMRGAAFAIPAGLGVQEGGLIVLCAIFGIPPVDALALSMVKRVADLALGIPGLVAWQALEGMRLRSGPAGGKEERPT